MDNLRFFFDAIGHMASLITVLGAIVRWRERRSR